MDRKAKHMDNTGHLLKEKTGEKQCEETMCENLEVISSPEPASCLGTYANVPHQCYSCTFYNKLL